MVTPRPDKCKHFTAILLFSMFLSTISGCTMSNYGKLESDKEVTRSFEAHQVLPDHKYYFWGTKSRPVVVVGINEGYELNSKMWVPIDPEPEEFRRLIDIVSLQGMGDTVQPWGFRILDQSGREAGIWYSASRAAAVEINESGQIVNLSPMRTAARGNQRE